jgi:hypothetical protein
MEEKEDDSENREGRNMFVACQLSADWVMIFVLPSTGSEQIW